MNKKGQALIEFVLLLPIIIILLLASIDIISIVVKKSEVETKVSDIIDVWDYKEIEELEKNLIDNDFLVDISKDDNFITINASKKINFITPFVNNILKDYSIKIKRVIPNE